MKHIAIIGGGITGMAAALLLRKEGHSVKIFSDSLGGDFNAGGLKYIHCTYHTERFFNNVLNLSYKIRKIVGTLYIDDNLHLFPEYLRENVVNGIRIQQGHWNKTRGNKEHFNMDFRCMNNPWAKNRKELALECKSDFVHHMKHLVEDSEEPEISFIQTRIDKDKFMELKKQYDYVIYTIPYKVCFPVKENGMKILNVLKFTIPFDYIKVMYKFWWDYIYFPELFYFFHRIYKQYKVPEICVETNIDLNTSQTLEEVKAQVQNWFSLEYRIDIEYDSKVSLKGHVITNKVKDYENVFFLGRFAEINSRITFDNVLYKMYEVILGQIK